MNTLWAKFKFCFRNGVFSCLAWKDWDSKSDNLQITDNLLAGQRAPREGSIQFSSVPLNVLMYLVEFCIIIIHIILIMYLVEWSMKEYEGRIVHKRLSGQMADQIPISNRGKIMDPLPLVSKFGENRSDWGALWNLILIVRESCLASYYSLST